MTTRTMFTASALAITALLAACGDNKSRPDGGTSQDGPRPDAMCSDCPPAPALGTVQLDRMGRPAINTALNHTFSPGTSTADAAKDAYNADTNVAGWQTAYVTEFAKSLGILDVLDGGIQGNGLCEVGETHLNTPQDCGTDPITGTAMGCGNQILYTLPVTATSYNQLAGLLANDVLYLDTSRPVCSQYLAVELGVATSVPHNTCGGRAPQYDVIDVTYSALAMGIKGFSEDGNLTPQFGDMVGPHTDYLSTFPYLGEPH
jgi:hypothetical protein